MNPIIKALVFDAYGTLFDVHSVVRRCEEFWPGKGRQLSQAWRNKQLEYMWQRSLMGRYKPASDITRDALAYACEALELSLSASRLEALMGEYLMLALYPDVLPSLERLSKYRLAILTVGSPDMIEPLVRRSRLPIELLLTVDEVKIFKPAPQVYELAVRKIGVPVNEICFVSSNGWDAAGAKSFGLRVYWINRAGTPLDRLGFEPDGVLGDLENLPRVLL